MARPVVLGPRRLLVPLLFSLLLVLASASSARENPLAMEAGPEAVESCADPTVVRGEESGDEAWYMVCTADPLGDWDREPGGGYRYRLLPIFRSEDLVHWAYVGEALAERPDWAEPDANLWAPELHVHEGGYHLYFSVTNTRPHVSGEPLCGSDSAIGVATSPSPAGPFVPTSTPVVAPRRAGEGCDFLATIDPEVIATTSGQEYIYYGSFYGGIEVRALAPGGLVSLAPTATALTVSDRFEAPEVVVHDGFFYLMLSVAGCCNGPLSGYAVVAGRAEAPMGPFVDREGIGLDDSRSGGTGVLSARGNRWVGPGHHTVVDDLAGESWAVYHAIDASEPYFADAVGFTKRPALLDPLDWIDGWPVVRGGWGASDCSQRDPAAHPGAPPGGPSPRRPDDAPSQILPAHSDEFDGPALSESWSWIRPPAAADWSVEDGHLRVATQDADLHEDSNSAPVLVRPAPSGDYVVETRVSLDVPANGCCYNYRQAGVVVYGDDDNYQKLVHVSIQGTRVTEWAKELGPVEPGFPRYDKSFVGPPADWTHLRVVVRRRFGGESYTAYTSRDGLSWSLGSTWNHALGAGARIGLVAMGGAGSTALFDYLRVHRLSDPPCDDPAQADPCDDDLDGTGDNCDVDDDGDGIEDLADCDAQDPDSGTPPVITSLRIAGPQPSVLEWELPPTAEHSDLTRCDLRELAPRSFGPCLANDIPDSAFEDPERPAPADGFGYLVRATDEACGGPGPYGSGRQNDDPGACP